MGHRQCSVGQYPEVAGRASKSFRLLWQSRTSSTCTIYQGSACPVLWSGSNFILDIWEELLGGLKSMLSSREESWLLRLLHDAKGPAKAASGSEGLDRLKHSASEPLGT